MVRKPRIVIGMSGGVDSSVAAALLKEQGYEVEGVMMKIWEDGDFYSEAAKDACFGIDRSRDMENARAQAETIGIPFHVVDLACEYRAEVLSYFQDEYFSARTPNPCVLCNKSIKFGHLVKRLRDLGIVFDLFATGHYARVSRDISSGRYILKKALDTQKDQSYFLYALDQDQLGSLILPLGVHSKADVRQMAKEYGLDMLSREESHDFVIGDDYSVFFSRKPAPGPIMDIHGNLMGEHRGIVHYTIGQRRRLGIATGEPLYVIDMDKANNTLIVGPRDALLAKEFIVSQVNWIEMVPGKGQVIEVRAKIRRNHEEALAELIPVDASTAYVMFHEPQYAITPGQAAVFYDGDAVLGGGIIETVKKMLA